MGGENPLDGSAVHPRVKPSSNASWRARACRFASWSGRPTLRGLRPADFADDQFGVPTVNIILGELEKPGRDPRPEFKTAVFRTASSRLPTWCRGMLLEGKS